MTRSSVLAFTSALATALVPIAAAGQPKGEVGQFSDVTVEGSVLEPSPIRVSDDAELAGLITAPEGFTVEVFARDLVNPRMLAVSDDFLIKREDGGYGYLGRLAGLAVAPDGALYVSDDANGIVYMVTYAGAEGAASAGRQTPPDVAPEPRQSQIALDLIEPTGDAGLTVSARFEPQSPIPTEHAADSDNAPPAIEWSDAPEGTQSYVLIVDDPDAAAPKPFTHWIAYDLPASMTSLREGLPTEPVLADIEGAKQGTNNRGSTGYFGPKPPVGDPPHNYHFQVFALDVAELMLPPGATREEVLNAMDGHVVAEGEIIGTYAPAPEAAAE